MKRRIRLTQSALDDIDEIWDYIAVENHGLDAADNLIDEFDRHFGLLLSHPQIGQSVDHLRPDSRRIVVKKRFLVFYELAEHGITVLRIVHGARLIRPEDLNKQIVGG